MHHYEDTFEGQGGLQLFAQSWRPAESPRASLAVLHGFGEHSDRYGNVVDWFLPKGYLVGAFDMRGMGRSPGRRGHIGDWNELREDVRLFLQWLKAQEPSAPTFLLGHSQGGLIALDYALHNTDGLVGVIASAPAIGSLPVSAPMMLVAKLFSRIWPTFAQDVKLDASALSRDPQVPADYTSDPLVHGMATARLGTEMMKAIETTQALACEMKLPCLIVHGAADRLVPHECSLTFYESMVIEDKERREYPGGYHEGFNDVHKEKVLADVERWVERHLGPEAGTTL
ncbi:MAG TPA: lysophospholipase [Anaerolineae bacterium]|nr:lysophospholipase [Anaerolineae bacterium]